MMLGCCCWRWLLGSVVAACLCINAAQAQSYKQFYGRLLRRFRQDRGPSTSPSSGTATSATTQPPPPPSSFPFSLPPTDAATETGDSNPPLSPTSGSLTDRGRFQEFYKDQWRASRGRGSGPIVSRSSSSPRTTIRVPTEPSSEPVVIPPRLAALLPRGVEFNPDGSVRLPPGVVLNPDGIPKSILAVLNGDPDYTRFRQMFLRQMCQRLIDGNDPSSFRFCFSLLAL